MDLEKFQKLYKKYSKLPLDRKIWDSELYEEYIEAINTSKECSDYYLTMELIKNKYDYTKNCCLDMAMAISRGVNKRGKIIYDDVDVVMRQWEDGTIGIPVHDGGSSIIGINYCPFCGAKLKNTDFENI